MTGIFTVTFVKQVQTSMCEHNVSTEEPKAPPATQISIHYRRYWTDIRASTNQSIISSIHTCVGKNVYHQGRTRIAELLKSRIKSTRKLKSLIILCLRLLRLGNPNKHMIFASQESNGKVNLVKNILKQLDKEWNFLFQNAVTLMQSIYSTVPHHSTPEHW